MVKFFDKFFILIALMSLMTFACGKKTMREDFVLLTTENENFDLQELKKHRAAVFVFLDYECPLSQNYTNKINELSEKYMNDEIMFFNVFPNLTAENAEVKRFKRKYKMEMPFIGDPDKELTNYLGATVTPEAFLVDSNKTVLYSGRIDNWASALGVKRQITTSHDLDNAINDFLNNREIKIKKTEAVGCLIE